jgi:photosystem II CP47 chlorophyll apoprotein
MMDNGYGTIIGWLGHDVFKDKKGHELFIHCMPTFFETFLVVLVDEKEIVRTDVPFRRLKSIYNVEQIGVTIEFYGGELDGVSFSDFSIMKKMPYVLNWVNFFEFDLLTLKSNDVLCSSPRGWFTFNDVTFALLFFFRYIWHGVRILFRDVFINIDPDLDFQVKFGTFQKLRDPITKRQIV